MAHAAPSRRRSPVVPSGQDADSRDVAGGPSVVSAEGPASPAVDVLSREEAERLLGAAWSVHGETVRDLADLFPSPIALDVLADLPETSPARAGVRVSVYRMEPDGRCVLVPRDWTHAIPTEEALARLVASGSLPPGEYRVRLRRGKVALPHVVVRIDAPEAPPALQSAGGGIGEALRMLTGGRPLLSLLPSSSAPARDVSADLDAIHERMDAIEGLVAQAVSALASKDGAGGSGLAEALAALAPLFAPKAAPDDARDHAAAMPRNGAERFDLGDLTR